MGKKRAIKKQLRAFIKSNRMIFVTLGGLAAGIAITRILGSDRARKVFHAAGGGLKNFGSKLTNGKLRSTIETA